MDKMYFCGLDIGSSMSKIILIDEKEDIIGYKFSKSGFEIRKTISDLYGSILDEHKIKEDQIKYIVATGYGRNVASAFFADEKVTEITCHAKGVHKIFPNCHTVIDIGGQDSKAIRLDADGRVSSFAMNDKCAAGSGRFLEVMSNVIGVNVSDLGPLSLKSKNKVSISSTCTVFAETEVISMIASEIKREDVIAGIHDAIATKVSALTRSTGIEDDVVMTGGVARNIGVVKSLEEKIGHIIHVPPEPLITGALGAALIAKNKFCKNN